LQHEPLSLREMLSRAPFRTLAWPRASGLTPTEGPPGLAASFLPRRGRPGREDTRVLLDGMAQGHALGGAFLLLAAHACARDRARAALLRASPGVVTAPRPPERTR
jgi:hypothetical protein